MTTGFHSPAAFLKILAPQNEQLARMGASLAGRQQGLAAALTLLVFLKYVTSNDPAPIPDYVALVAIMEMIVTTCRNMDADRIRMISLLF